MPMVHRHEHEALEQQIAYLRSTLEVLERELQERRRGSGGKPTKAAAVPPPAARNPAETSLPIGAG